MLGWYIGFSLNKSVMKLYINTCFKRCPLLHCEDEAVCVQRSASLQSFLTEAVEEIIHCQTSEECAHDSSTQSLD